MKDEKIVCLGCCEHELDMTDFKLYDTDDGIQLRAICPNCGAEIALCSFGDVDIFEVIDGVLI